MRATFLTGEKRWLRQAILGNDVITSATWEVDPIGPFLTNPVRDETSAEVMFASSNIGTFLVTVTMTLDSGQIVKGQIAIHVVKIRI